MKSKTPLQREEAIKIISQITEECNSHGTCTNNCPFFFGRTRWCIFDGLPYNWEIIKEGGATNGND